LQDKPYKTPRRSEHMNDAKPESLKPVIKKINLDIMSGPTLRAPFKTLENTTVWAADKVDSLNIL